MDSFATMTSLSPQHGVPLQLLVDKFTHTRFEALLRFNARAAVDAAPPRS